MARRAPARLAMTSAKRLWLARYATQVPGILLPCRLRTSSAPQLVQQSINGAAAHVRAVAMLLGSNRAIWCYHACIPLTLDAALSLRPLRCRSLPQIPGLALSAPGVVGSAHGSGSLRGAGAIDVE